MPVSQIDHDAVHRQGQNFETAIGDLRKVLQTYGEAAAPALGLWFSVPVVGMVAMQFRTASAGMIAALRTMRAEMRAAGIADGEGVLNRFLPDGDEREE